jgi:hypothetical protein
MTPKQKKILSISVGQTGIILSLISIYSQNILLQSIAQVTAALSGLIWVSILMKRVSVLSLVSLLCCCAAVLFPSPWLLFTANTCRAIDYQIILWKSEI